MSNFKGRYFLHVGGDYLQYGKIADQFDGIILIQRLDGSDKELVKISPMLAVPLDVVFETFDDGGAPTGDWQFFETEEALRAYLDWLDEVDSGPEKPKIVPLRKP